MQRIGRLMVISGGCAMTGTLITSLLMDIKLLPMLIGISTGGFVGVPGVMLYNMAHVSAAPSDRLNIFDCS